MNMKKLTIFFTLCLLITNHLTAQISHGGKPLPMTEINTRSGSIFKEMPSFDIKEQLRIDSLNESDLRSGYHFAYKFMTDFTPENSGTRFTLADGTRVWRLGIRSTGAFSINVLFSEYEVPEGARLFLYNPDQTHILGSFNQLNNSELGLLPVAPVKGDELIIEYQEPANAPFHGKLKVGEVNHDYRGFKRYEPYGDSPYFVCMKPLACLQGETDKYDEIGRSVILIVINGETACTGTLINNTENDGKPYILTASHCLNDQFRADDPDYELVAGNIVTFFNYESPLCDPVMRGTEEMSMASTLFRATNEETDMALLELMETPPVYYQPYYAGWNAKDQGIAPYIGIHHPNASVKRVVKTDNVVLSSYPKYPFEKDGHWHVEKWTEGCTYGGSSGSPLFDDNNRIIGGLSGGESKCSYLYNDYYFALAKSWDFPSDADKQLKAWLDPFYRNKELTCNGLDPYSTTPAIRLSNISESGKTSTIETTALPSPGTGPAFGNNSLGMTEFAEIYKTTGDATIFGTYIVNPAISDSKNIDIEITVYSGSDKPERLLHSESFQPKFTTFEKEDFESVSKPLNRDQESFITFSEPVTVSGTFFVGYRIKSSTDNVSFSAFNLPKGETTKNTTWINYKGQWIEATAHPASPMSTSLFVDPVIQYNTASANASIEKSNPIRIFMGANPGTVHVLLPEDIRQARYTLFTADGKTLQGGTVYAGQNTVTTPSATAGIYLIQVTYNNESFTQKILF